MDNHAQNTYGENPYAPGAGVSMENGQDHNPYAPDSQNTQGAVSHGQYTYTQSWMTGSSSQTGANPMPYGQSFFPAGAQQPYTAGNQPYVSGYQPYTSPQNAYYGQSESKGVGFAVTGLVLGILSILVCIFMVFDWILAVPGLIFSSLALAKKDPASQDMALAGLICNIIGFVLSAVLFGIIMQ